MGALVRQLEAFRETEVARWKRVVVMASYSMLVDMMEETPVADPSFWETPRKLRYNEGGRLRANWQVGLNSAPQGFTENVDPDGEVTLGKCLMELESYNESTQAIYIVNNAPHAIPVEFGWSEQAPTGMMRTNVMAWPAYLLSAKRMTP